MIDPDFDSLDLIWRIFTIIFPLILIISIGYWYGRLYKPDMRLTNQVNLDVFIPVLVLDVMLSSNFVPSDYLALSFLGLLIVLGSGLLAYPFARLMNYQWKTFVPPMMFINSGNLGLPLILFAFGKQAMPAAIVLFTIENLLHFTLGLKMMDHRAHWFSLLKKPIVIAAFVGVLFSQINYQIPQLIEVPMHMMGQVSIPLLLFALGVRLIEIDFSTWKIGLISAVFCPLSGLLMAWLGLNFISLPPQQLPVLILFSILPPAVLNFVIAERYQQEPHLVASLVLISNLGSLVVVPVTLWFVL